MRIYRFIRRVFYRWHFLYGKKGVVVLGKGIVSKCSCSCSGSGNIIVLDAGCSMRNCNIVLKGNNNQLIIHSGCHFSDVTFWMEDDGNLIEIGQGTTIEGGSQLAALEGTSIKIGDDCMLANNVMLRTSDSHSILDKENIRINNAADITIGKHVWAGFGSLILKGCKIPDGSVVAAKSVVTASNKMKANSIIAGMPARVIKEDVGWKRERI